ncbi:transposase [Nonomuraea thailandensis]|uniref:Transposase n=3 Tax=Nonomuraea thailandensis TaxID=1188745 RepID=A0A9X2G9N1_9ACTN|nr:IS5 family transposase [Nonomuraea thailandensis]MCP2353615.1 transposase [Nonomuraea thailandensis]
MNLRRPYRSDISDARWALIEPTLTAWRQARLDRRPTGAPAPTDLREIFNAILYLNRTGIAWTYLPHDFPPHGTVYSYYAAWRDEGIFAQLNYDLTGLARAKEGREAEPTAAVIDTQTIKTSTNPPTATQGTDAAKKIVGRKRSVATDALGLLLAVVVCAASVSENQAGIQVLDQAKAAHPALAVTWVDTGFKNQFAEHAATLGVNAEVVHRDPETRGFHVLKRRWVIERTFGWLMLHRRLARDYETLPASSEAMIHIAMIDNASKRITDESTPTWRGTH